MDQSRLVEECERYGLPVGLDGLLRHLEGSKVSIVGGWQLAAEAWEERAKAAEETLRSQAYWADRVANMWRDSPETRAALAERYPGLAWALDHLAYPQNDDGADASGDGPRQPPVEEATSAPSSPEPVPMPRRPLDDPQTFAAEWRIPRLRGRKRT